MDICFTCKTGLTKFSDLFYVKEKGLKKYIIFCLLRQIEPFDVRKSYEKP